MFDKYDPWEYLVKYPYLLTLSDANLHAKLMNIAITQQPPAASKAKTRDQLTKNTYPEHPVFIRKRRYRNPIEEIFKANTEHAQTCHQQIRRPTTPRPNTV